MFELADLTRKASIVQRHDSEKGIDGPILHYGAADEADYDYNRPKFEDGEVLAYFRPRRISRTWLQYWMILQSLMLFFQLILYAEVSGHASLYESVVHAHCNESSAGSCKSRLWQSWYHFEHRFGSNKREVEAPIHFEFSSTSRSPLSVQVGVIPDPPNLHIPYELVLKRHSSNQLPERTYYEYRTTGLSAVILTESEEDQKTNSTLNPILGLVPTVKWEGTVKLLESPSRYSRTLPNGEVIFGNHRINSFQEKIRDELKSVKLVVNEMNAFEISEYRATVGSKCEFEKSWAAVMTQSLSVGIRRLEWIRNLLGLSIFASAIVTFLVWTWYGGRRTIDGLSFHYLVAAKGALQDMPLQAIMLWYICAWFEAGGGERCQLCLLDPQHCEHLHPFHPTNLLLLTLILGSSLSNQFLFSTDPSQLKSEDDSSFVTFVRFVIACLSILPFSTAMVAFNGSLVQLPGLVHSIFLMPCFVGWVALFSLICFPITALLDTDEYSY